MRPLPGAHEFGYNRPNPTTETAFEEERPMQYVAIGIALALGVGAGISAGYQVAEVFVETWWLPWAVGAGACAAVFAVLYVPLLRPIADVLNDRLSATHQRFRSTRTGTGIDEVPHHLDRPTRDHRTTR
jgi:hypothetical protein